MNKLSKIKLALKWWKLWKTMPVYSWIKASDLYSDGKYSQAAELYALGIKQHSKHKAVNYALLDYAYCLYKLSRYDESVRILEKLIEKKIEIEEVYTLVIKQYAILGKSHLSLHVISQAREVLCQSVYLLALHLEVSVLYETNLKKVVSLKNELEKARESLNLNDEKLLVIDAALAHFELAHGDLSMADQMIARLLATMKAPYEVYLLRAERFIDMGRILHAREQLRKAKRLRKRDPRADMMLAKTFLMPGDFHEPASAMDIALEVCKKTLWQNADAVSLLAECYEIMDDEEQAEIFYAYANRLQAINGLHSAVVSNLQSDIERLQQIVH